MNNRWKIILGVLIVSGLVFAAVETKFYGNINLQGNKVVSMGTPTSSTDGATKAYADSVLAKANTNLYAEKAVLDTEIGGKLNRSGGTMNGAINMSGYAIHNVPTPIGASDCATKSYVDSIAVEGGLPSLAVKYGGAYPPIVHLNSNTNGSLSVKVVNQFVSSITFSTENTSLVADQTFNTKTWKVGENIKVNYGIGAGEYSATNGTLIAKDDGGAILGRWGITFPPTAYPSFKVYVHDELVSNNSALSMSGFFDGSQSVDFGITNTSTISASVLLVMPTATMYVNDIERTTTITPDGESPQAAPTTLSLSVPAKECKWFKANFGITPEMGGVRWQFDIATSGSTNRYGQFYLWAN